MAWREAETVETAMNLLDPSPDIVYGEVLVTAANEAAVAAALDGNVRLATYSGGDAAEWGLKLPRRHKFWNGQHKLLRNAHRPENQIIHLVEVIFKVGRVRCMPRWLAMFHASGAGGLAPHARTRGTTHCGDRAAAQLEPASNSALTSPTPRSATGAPAWSSRRAVAGEGEAGRLPHRPDRGQQVPALQLDVQVPGHV
jgi:hypothetical protein